MIEPRMLEIFFHWQLAIGFTYMLETKTFSVLLPLVSIHFAPHEEPGIVVAQELL